MPYIGNTVQNQGFAPAIDYFSGNGVTVTFTLSRPVASVAQLTAVIDNVIQNPSSAFTVAGNAITFTSAPLSGTNNIWVEYTSLVTTYAAISQDPSVIGDITATGGFLATGDFGNTYVDGTIVDYVTGNTRITTGPVDGITLYNGGPNARYALAAWDTSGNLTNAGNVLTTGNVGVGTTSPATKLEVDFSNAGTTIASAPLLTLKNTSYTNSAVTGIVSQNSQGGNASGIDFISINQVTDGAGASGAIRVWQNTSGTKAYQLALEYGGEFKFNSGYGSAATAYGCRAWVNWNGNGGASIRASGNVSSVTYNGAGDYTVNFTTAMPDANYCTSWNSGMKSVVWGLPLFVGLSGFGTTNCQSTTQVRVIAVTPADAGQDNPNCCVAIFR